MSVLAIAEIREGELRHATFPAVAAAKKLGELADCGFDILVLGQGAASAAEELKKYGAGKVFFSQAPEVGSSLAETHAAAARDLVLECGHKYVLMSATSTGKDMMPRLAALLDAGMAGDVVAFEKSNDEIVYVRPMAAGNIEARIAIDTSVKAMTIQDAAFDAAEPVGGQSPAEEVSIQIDPESLGARFIGLQLSKSSRPELSEAKIVVSVGRGAKDAEGVKLVEKLADKLRAALGASRALVDEGLLPNDLQVGQTGKVVAPDLYIAVGISGAIQHVAGMKKSKVIVAINKDDEAPIFEVADYGLVEDLFTAVPELLEKLP